MKYIFYYTVIGLITVLALYQYISKRSTITSSNARISTAPTPSSINENLLNFPIDQSSEEGKKWIDSILKMEKNTKVINISSCKPSPLVLKVKKGSDFQVKNNSRSEITLYSHGNEYKIPSLETAIIKAVFDPDTTGFFGYRCKIGSEPQSPVVGILHLTE